MLIKKYLITSPDNIHAIISVFTRDAVTQHKSIETVRTLFAVLIVKFTFYCKYRICGLCSLF